MKYTVLSAALIAASILFTPAQGSPLDDKIAALKKVLQAEPPPKVDPSRGQSPFYGNPALVAASLDQIFEQADNGGVNAEAQITQILTAFPSDAVQKAGEDLIAEIRLERKERTDAGAAEIRTLLKRTSDDVAKAKKPEDLDDLLVELQKFQNDRSGGYNPENQGLYQQVASAFEFTKLWQNYLSHLANGQGQLATQDLQNLSQNNYGVGIIPRSQILALLAPPAAPPDKDETPAATSPAEGILKGITTLDEMEPALRKLESLRQNDGQAQTAANNLAPLVQLYTSVKAGLPANVSPNFGNNNNGLTVSLDLQSQLLVFVLQHYFDSYQGTPPAAGERPDAFVSRVIADAVNREDWALLKKALNGQAYLNRNSLMGMYSSGNVSAGVDYLVAALNQEEAGQYALAVVSYQSALKVADTTIPAKLIGDKLAAIQKDHAKEYEDGMQMVLSPPVPRYYPGMMPNQMYRPGMPGYPGYPQTQPNPGLAIPRASTTQTTPAASSTSGSTTVIIPAPSVFSTNQPPVVPQSPTAPTTQ